MNLTLDAINKSVALAMAPKLDAQTKLITELQEKYAAGDPSTDGDADKDKALSVTEFGNLLEAGKVLNSNGIKMGIAELQNLAADMERGVASTITNIDRNVPGKLPIASALVGGFSALVVAEIVDGLLMRVNQPNVNVAAIAKLIVAAVGFKPAQRYIGQPGAVIFAGLLIFSVARDFLPIDEWLNNLTSWVSGNGAALSGRQAMHNQINGYSAATVPSLPAGMSNVIPAHHGVVTQFDEMFR